MATRGKSIQAQHTFEVFCDWGIITALCGLIFVLPASIAILDIFAAIAIVLYLIKKIYRIIVDWPLKASSLDFWGKFSFIWKGFAPPANFLNRPLQILVLAFILSVAMSQFHSLSLVAFFGKFLKGVFLVFCFIEVFSNDKRIWVFLAFFFVSALIAGISGIYQHYTGYDLIKKHLIGTENGQSTHRISSTFFGANGFGAYLLPVIALVIHLLYTALARKRAWVLAGALTLFFVLFLTCLCWTYSRSSWVGYVMILVLAILMDRRKTFVVGIFFLVFYFVFLPSLNSVRNLDLINDNASGVKMQSGAVFHGFKINLNEAGSGRKIYWKKAIGIVSSSPVWGVGLNTYTKFIMRDPDQANRRYAHNCYLQMAAETGVLGLGSFLWMLSVLFWQGFKSSRHGHDAWTLAILQGTLAGLYGFLLQSFFDNTFYTVQLGVLMWVMIGLLMALIRLNNKGLERG